MVELVCCGVIIMEVEYAIRFGKLIMKTAEDKDGKKVIHILLEVKKKDGSTELLPYYAELPVPAVNDLEGWMKLTLMDNAERFFRLFTFVGVPCPHCGKPLPVMINPFTELNFCVDCGGELP